MPDPNWSGQYNMAQTPEGNGFVRATFGDAVVVSTTGGAPANRKIAISSADGTGWATFQLDVPTFSNTTGITAEYVASVTGGGNAGVEIQVPQLFAGIQMYADRITVYVYDGQGPHSFPTASNGADTTVRITILNGALNVYRNGSLVTSMTAPPMQQDGANHVMFWGEEGGTATFKALRYFDGGAVVPG